MRRRDRTPSSEDDGHWKQNRVLQNLQVSEDSIGGVTMTEKQVTTRLECPDKNLKNSQIGRVQRTVSIGLSTALGFTIYHLADRNLQYDSKVVGTSSNCVKNTG